MIEQSQNTFSKIKTGDINVCLHYKQRQSVNYMLCSLHLFFSPLGQSTSNLHTQVVRPTEHDMFGRSLSWTDHGLGESRGLLGSCFAMDHGAATQLFGPLPSGSAYLEIATALNMWGFPRSPDWFYRFGWRGWATK